MAKQKCTFRKNIEKAIVDAGAANILKPNCVFLDRHKCSDRIKFAFTNTSKKKMEAIQANVEKMYPNNYVNVYFNTNPNGYAYCNRYTGVAVSVAHLPGEKL